MNKRSFIRLLTLATTLTISACYGQIALVNGASFSLGAVSPGSFATVFGQNLCSQTAIGAWVAPRQLPTTLGGCSLTVNGQAAMLHYVSPGQINFIVPEKAAFGAAAVVIADGGKTQTGTIAVQHAGPGVFSLNGMGVGKGAILHGLLWQKGPFSITTNGKPTPLSLYMTGLDLSVAPKVTIGGVDAKVTWYGEAPGFAGLMQLNLELPAMAGVGTVPVTITSDGKTSNVTFLNLLPTTAMMAGNPRWPLGKMIQENKQRGREASSIAFRPPGTVNTVSTVLVSDEDDSVVRMISLDTKATLATISLPDGSGPEHIAVSADGSLAAVVLPEKASVALIELTNNNKVSVIGVGNYPTHLAFAGTNLLVTNHAGRSVSVIDLPTKLVTHTVDTGAGPAGVAVSGNTAVVANMQDGSLTLIDLTTFKPTTVVLADNSRPHEVAISSSGKAVITMPLSNSCLVYDLTTGKTSSIETGAWKAFGPRAIAINKDLVFLANQMSGSVTVIDLAQGKVLETFPVDPGPRSLAVAGEQLLVLSQGSGVIDVVDLKSYTITGRIDAEESDKDNDRDGEWKLPIVLSVSPATGKAGSDPTVTVSGFNLQKVTSLEFHLMGHGMGMGTGDKSLDSHIKVTDVQPSADGRQVTATLHIAAEAVAGLRVVKLSTDRGYVTGPLTLSLFLVTAK